MATNPNPAAAAAETENIRAQAVQAEQTRITEIYALAKRHHMADQATGWVREGKTVDQVRQLILEKLGDSARPFPAGPEGALVELSADEEKNFSFMRAIRSLAGMEKPGFEKEVSDSISKKLGRSPTGNGMFIPTNVHLPGAKPGLLSERAIAQRAALLGLSPAQMRTLAATSSAAVATDLRAQDFIELLRNLMSVVALGARVLTDLRGNVDFPKQTAAASLTWTGENPGSAVGLTDPTLAKVSISPKSAMAATRYTRQLVVQSSLDVEQLIREDLAAVIGLGIDLAAINGSGASNQPTGILVVSGTNLVAIGTNGGAPVWDNIVNLETQLGTNNIPLVNIGLLTTPGIKGKLRRTQQFSGTNGAPIWSNDNTVLGYPGVVSNQVPATLTKGSGTNLHAMILAAWQNLIIGQWEALEVIVDPYTEAGKGNIIVTVQAMLDIAVRYASAFSIIKDADAT